MYFLKYQEIALQNGSQKYKYSSFYKTFPESQGIVYLKNKTQSSKQIPLKVTLPKS